MKGERILIVVYEDGDIHPNAAAFSNMEAAEIFAFNVDGRIIDTTINEQVIGKDESHG